MMLQKSEMIVVPVLGMHRSGAALVTRMLNLLGLELGWPLLPPTHEAPRGIWEHKAFASVNQSVLGMLKVHPDGLAPRPILHAIAKATQKIPLGTASDSLQSQVGAMLEAAFRHPLWGWKDPRTVITWPLWQRLLTALGYTRIRPVVVLRHPSSCAQSMIRHGVAARAPRPRGVGLEAHLLDMWRGYHERLEAGAGEDALFLCLEDLQDPELAPAEVARLAQHLGFATPPHGPFQAAMAWLEPNPQAAPPAIPVDGETLALHARLVGRAQAQRAAFLASAPEIPAVMPPDTTPAQSADWSICVLRPLGYPHSRAFDEVGQALHAGFAELGIDAPLIGDLAHAQGTTIIIGANLLPLMPGARLPKDAIIYNLEQVDPGSPWMQEGYLTLLRKHRVWDYASQNVSRLAKLGVTVEGICEIGHAAVLERIQPAPEQDIDVLFYGSIGERRQATLDALAARGLKVMAVSNLYGHLRDDLVVRAKVVVNIHHFPAKVLEIVRLSYLMANGVPIVSEPGAEPGEDAPYAEAIAFTPYDGLVERCADLVADAQARAALGAQAQACFRARPQAEFLRGLIT